MKGTSGKLTKEKKKREKTTYQEKEAPRVVGLEESKKDGG